MGLAKREEQALQVAAQPTVADMLNAVIQKGISSENVGALEKLVELYERMEVRNAEKSFALAFTTLQAELPTIVASTPIKNRGKYEKFEDVMRQIAGPLQKNGFSVSFSMDVNDKRIVETCHLTHIDGHTRTNSFAVRVGNNSDSETQADCKAATTAKRNALLNALNIVIRQDALQDEEGGDASIEGDPNKFVTPEQADEIERRVKETNSIVAAFLKFAGAPTFREIKANKYSEIDDMLHRKESGGK